MEKIVSCGFNMDTACVELRFADGREAAIDTTAVENEVAETICRCSELDWLVYSKPMEYAQLVLGGGIEEYLKGTVEHRLEN